MPTDPKARVKQPNFRVLLQEPFYQKLCLQKIGHPPGKKVYQDKKYTQKNKNSRCADQQLGIALQLAIGYRQVKGCYCSLWILWVAGTHLDKTQKRAQSRPKATWLQRGRVKNTMVKLTLCDDRYSKMIPLLPHSYKHLKIPTREGEAVDFNLAAWILAAHRRLSTSTLDVQILMRIHSGILMLYPSSHNASPTTVVSSTLPHQSQATPGQPRALLSCVLSKKVYHL